MNMSARTVFKDESKLASEPGFRLDLLLQLPSRKYLMLRFWLCTVFCMTPVILSLVTFPNLAFEKQTGLTQFLMEAESFIIKTIVIKKLKKSRFSSNLCNSLTIDK